MKNYSVQEIPNEEADELALVYMNGMRDGVKLHEWKGLTKDEVHRAVVQTGIHVFEGDIYKFVDLLEDILREKNGG